MAVGQHDVPDAFKEDVIQDYSYSAGFEITKIFIIVVGMVLFAIFSWLRSGTGPEPNAGWGILFFLGVVFAVGIGWWIWRSYIRHIETGSRIDLGNRKIIWWDGQAPAHRNTVDIDSLAWVELVLTDAEADSYDINLVGRTGEKVSLPSKCVRNSKDWVRALRSEFPDIELKSLGEDTESDSRDGISLSVSDLPLNPISPPFIHLPHDARSRKNSNS